MVVSCFRLPTEAPAHGGKNLSGVQAGATVYALLDQAAQMSVAQRVANGVANAAVIACFHSRTQAMLR